MKTILYLNCTDAGSTGKIIKDTAEVISEAGYKSVLCAPNITEPNTDTLKKYRMPSRVFRAFAYRAAKITGNFYGWGSFTARSVIRKIKQEKVDIVHIHCANGHFINLYKLLKWLKKNKKPTVVTNHAEFFYTGNCDHAYDCDRWMNGCGKCPRHLSKIDTTAKWWRKMKACFVDFPQLIVTSVSPWVMERSSASPIMEGVSQRLVLNGANTDVFHIYSNRDVWKDYGIQTQGKRVVLYVTACFYGDRPEKGSEHLLRLAAQMAEENVLFVVAGSYVQGVKVPDNICLLGKISDQTKLAQLYSAADLALITSQRETFSMPVAEALCCGTPIVGFRAGGPESIALEEYCQFVEYGDVLSLAEALRKKWLAYKTEENTTEISLKAFEKYDKKGMAQQYMLLYEEMMEAKMTHE